MRKALRRVHNEMETRPISRQVIWQEQMAAKGCCRLCASPTGGYSLCEACRAKQHARYHAKASHQNARPTRTYRRQARALPPVPPLVLLRRREQTYRTPEKARRAFFKWAVKQGLYNPLRIVKYGEEVAYHRRAPLSCQLVSYCWCGHALFFPGNKFDRARLAWNEEFERHRQPVLARWESAVKEQRESRKRSRLMKSTRVRHFFRVLSAGGAFGR